MCIEVQYIQSTVCCVHTHIHYSITLISYGQQKNKCVYENLGHVYIQMCVFWI